MELHSGWCWSTTRNTKYIRTNIAIVRKTFTLIVVISKYGGVIDISGCWISKSQGIGCTAQTSNSIKAMAHIFNFTTTKNGLWGLSNSQSLNDIYWYIILMMNWWLKPECSQRLSCALQLELDDSMSYLQKRY